MIHDGPPSRQLAGSANVLRVWIDFVCPYCFLAEPALLGATQGLDITIEWMPFELRPAPQPTLRPEGDYLQTAWTRSVYPLARQLGVDIRLPDVSPQPYSRLAFEGMQVARQFGKEAAYVDAVFRAFFQQSRDIGDATVLQSIAESIGVPAEEFRTALDTGRYRDKHEEALTLARELNISAVPTLMWGDQRIEGIPDAGLLQRMIQIRR